MSNEEKRKKEIHNDMITENTMIKEKVRVWNEKQKRIKHKNDEYDKLKEEKLKKDQLSHRILNCIRCKSNNHHHHHQTPKNRKLDTEEH